MRTAGPESRVGPPTASPAATAWSGFTLLEVLLAITLAGGLLFAVLYFYQQSANLRDELLRETEQVSAARLIMDRLTAELRSVPGRSYYTPALSGSPTLLQFIKTGLPSRAAWTSAEYGRAASPETDLRLVKYTISGDGTNVAGLLRTEEPMVTKQAVKAAPNSDPFEQTVPAPPDPLTEALHYLSFRYHDGTAWRDSWNSERLPRGIEVTLAVEAPPTNAVEGEVSSEVFRRVIFLPASGASTVAPSTPTGNGEPPAEATPPADAEPPP